MNLIQASPVKTTISDVLIIGSGAAGLSAALKIDDDLSVIVASKSSPKQNSTWFAQGGIASVNMKEDSFQSHIEDTLICGSFLNDKEVVKTIIESAPNVLSWLVDIGMEFSRHKNDFHLHQEGGHGFRRIFHFEDATGKALQTALLKNISKAKNISSFNHLYLLELLTDENDGSTIIGGKFLNQTSKDIEVIFAKKTVIASGGACNIYQFSSSPTTATGDGVACAYRKGAKLANLEFTQFHPTCFFNESARNLLLTEALRGEGAKLRLKSGSEFMLKYHEKLELAPRDIVARAIDTELKLSGEDCVFLDITHKNSKEVKQHFPTIYKELKKYGYDLTADQIPVVPAAHYFCGGIMTNLSAQTNLKNLYAIGEAAHTNLHGANRLASNSLLECLVMGHRSAFDISKSINRKQKPKEIKITAKPSDNKKNVERVLIKHLWDQVRQTMSNYVGIMRTTARLNLALHTIENIEKESELFKENFDLVQDYLELQNLICIAKLTIKCALMRKESRGLHFNQDYPNLDKNAKSSVISVKTEC